MKCLCLSHQIETQDLLRILGEVLKLYWELNFNIILLSIPQKTIQTLNNMLGVCVINFKSCWDDHLHLVKYAYKNSFHQSIVMAPLEVLYRRACETPICRNEMGEGRIT